MFTREELSRMTAPGRKSARRRAIVQYIAVPIVVATIASFAITVVVEKATA